VIAHSNAEAALDYPLAARFPRLGRRVPRVRLSAGPSPVTHLSRLSAHLGRDDIWLKNDGVFGAIYGGNKPRKLQFILADAHRRGATRILTTGTIGTNHGLATALYAKEFFLETGLLLTYEKPSPEATSNLLQMAASGASIHYTRAYPLTALAAPYFVARYWRRDGRLPYLLGPGGSSVLASFGYADAAFELADQVRAGEVPEPAWIVIPLGTGGTVAGLLAGLRLAGLDSQVLAVAATRAPTTWRPLVLRLARAVVRRIARESGDPDVTQVRLDGLHITRDWIGPGLGEESLQGAGAKAALHELEGQELDTVYTAKSMAALIDLSQRGELPGPVLFWHTYNALPLPPIDERSAAGRLPASLRHVCSL
jgi:D-cysteine desulfhydrase